jgi:hypothetical protein
MIEEEKLTAWAPQLEPVFLQWRARLDTGHLDEWEFVAAYVLIFIFLNRPREKWPKQSEIQLSSHQKDNFNFFCATARAFLTGLGEESMASRWENCLRWIYGPMKNLRGVPEKVLQSLRCWREGDYQLKMFHRVPSSREMLRFQKEGWRCVSVLLSETEIKKPVETGRDVWSFCLHDLLHASHFFGDSEAIHAQRYLSHFFLSAWESTSMADWIEQDPQFAAEFEYVAADMNAHPVYVWMSFYAAVLDFFKRSVGGGSENSLTPEQEKQWIVFWNNWLIEIFPVTSSLYEAFVNIPLMPRGQQDFSALQRELLQVGANEF